MNKIEKIFEELAKSFPDDEETRKNLEKVFSFGMGLGITAILAKEGNELEEAAREYLNKVVFSNPENYEILTKMLMKFPNPT